MSLGIQLFGQCMEFEVLPCYVLVSLTQHCQRKQPLFSSQTPELFPILLLSTMIRYYAHCFLLNTSPAWELRFNSQVQQMESCLIMTTRGHCLNNNLQADIFYF